MTTRHRLFTSRRRMAALVTAIAALLCFATPAHAEAEAVYQIPGSACHPNLNNLCEAKTWVNVLLPDDYAACAAEQTAGEHGLCGTPDVTLTMTVFLNWFPGSCASEYSSGILDTPAPGFTIESGGDSSGAASCSSVDSAWTATFALEACPGTTFRIYADIRGNADGTFSNGFSVNSSGPCAALYDVATVEGPS